MALKLKEIERRSLQQGQSKTKGVDVIELHPLAILQEDRTSRTFSNAGCEQNRGPCTNNDRASKTFLYGYANSKILDPDDSDIYRILLSSRTPSRPA